MDGTAGRLAYGFLVGALAMLTFHQCAVGLLHAAGLVPFAPFNPAPHGPLGVPAVVSGAFWAGLWGMVLVPFIIPWATRRLPEALAGFLSGLTLPVLVLFFVVAPLQGQPIAYGAPPAMLLLIALIHAVWGLGIVWLARGLRPGPARGT